MCVDEQNRTPDAVDAALEVCDAIVLPSLAVTATAAISGVCSPSRCSWQPSARLIPCRVSQGVDELQHRSIFGQPEPVDSSVVVTRRDEECAGTFNAVRGMTLAG